MHGNLVEGVPRLLEERVQRPKLNALEDLRAIRSESKEECAAPLCRQSHVLQVDGSPVQSQVPLCAVLRKQSAISGAPILHDAPHDSLHAGLLGEHGLDVLQIDQASDT